MKNRVIKFRAWDEQAKVMHNEFQFIKSGEEGNDWVVFTSDKQGLDNPDMHPFHNPHFQQQFKVMQFTGLHDKNGVEIYEGDIVKAKVNEVTKENIFDDPSFIQGKSKYVTGEKVDAIWTIEHVNHLTYTGFMCYGLDRRFHKPITKSVLFNNKVEVIGNIYENHELLECE